MSDYYFISHVLNEILDTVKTVTLPFGQDQFPTSIYRAKQKKVSGRLCFGRTKAMRNAFDSPFAFLSEGLIWFRGLRGLRSPSHG
jgi:hypothetical protein